MDDPLPHVFLIRCAGDFQELEGCEAALHSLAAQYALPLADVRRYFQQCCQESGADWHTCYEVARRSPMWLPADVQMQLWQRGLFAAVAPLVSALVTQWEQMAAFVEQFGPVATHRTRPSRRTARRAHHRHMKRG